jgi:hypothetical protein
MAGVAVVDCVWPDACTVNELQLIRGRGDVSTLAST